MQVIDESLWSHQIGGIGVYKRQYCFSSVAHITRSEQQPCIPVKMCSIFGLNFLWMRLLRKADDQSQESDFVVYINSSLKIDRSIKML